MIIKPYIKEFEKLGFGMFVHFGVYSLIDQGEWARKLGTMPHEQYDQLYHQFDPDPDWANHIAAVAKNAGCRYITLTTRHHDGFSLYDTKGLNDYDAMHACGRDLVREFVNACHAYGLMPVFYHTLLDWKHPDYSTNFPRYLEYLRASVKLLCTNYGKIGGIWFDGMWDKRDADWEEDRLYHLIRTYQPEAMIINNTGLSHRGELGNIELDSVTFERGKPQPINMADSPKYIASEMNEVLCDHWGYAKDDLDYKPTGRIIEELAACRRYRSNFLLNIGPRGDGTLKPIDEAMFGIIGQWTAYFDEALHEPYPTKITIKDKPDDFILQNGSDYYLFCHHLPMLVDPSVGELQSALYEDKFPFKPVIKTVRWLDCNSPLPFTQKDGITTIKTNPFHYGHNLVVRVAKITTSSN